MSNSLSFGERPEQFAQGRSILVSDREGISHSRSFLVSDLSNSLTSHQIWWATSVIRSYCSLKRREWANHSFKKNLQKMLKNIPKNTILVKCFERIAHFLWAKEQVSNSLKKRVICSFALLSWVTWANRSRLLFCHEWPERFAHSCSLLSWATWAICSQLLICPKQSERIAHSRSFDLSEWVNSQPWFCLIICNVILKDLVENLFVQFSSLVFAPLDPDSHPNPHPDPHPYGHFWDPGSGSAYKLMRIQNTEY